MSRNRLKNSLSRASKIIVIIVGIVTGLSTIAGVLWNLYEFAISTRERTKAAQIAQLTSYTSFGEILQNYRTIEDMTEDFMCKHRNTNWNSQFVGWAPPTKTLNVVGYLRWTSPAETRTQNDGLAGNARPTESTFPYTRRIILFTPSSMMF